MFKYICAWCGYEFGQTKLEGTHGICPDCMHNTLKGLLKTVVVNKVQTTVCAECYKHLTEHNNKVTVLGPAKHDSTCFYCDAKNFLYERKLP